jgi:hypothetical protein
MHAADVHHKAKSTCTEIERTSIFSKYTLMLVRTMPLTTVLTARLARDVMLIIHGAGIATETPSSRLHRHPVLPVVDLALLCQRLLLAIVRIFLAVHETQDCGGGWQGHRSPHLASSRRERSQPLDRDQWPLEDQRQRLGQGWHGKECVGAATQPSSLLTNTPAWNRQF